MEPAEEAAAAKEATPEAAGTRAGVGEDTVDVHMDANADADAGAGADADAGARADSRTDVGAGGVDVAAQQVKPNPPTHTPTHTPTPARTPARLTVVPLPTD